MAHVRTYRSHYCFDCSCLACEADYPTLASGDLQRSVIMAEGKDGKRREEAAEVAAEIERVMEQLQDDHGGNSLLGRIGNLFVMCVCLFGCVQYVHNSNHYSISTYIYKKISVSSQLATLKLLLLLRRDAVD